MRCLLASKPEEIKSLASYLDLFYLTATVSNMLVHTAVV